MARDEVRIYRSHKPLKTALAVIFIVLAVLITLAAGIFFGFRKYIVYTSDGVKLEVPWLEEPAEDSDVPDSAEGDS